jgi:hypothetical protein
MKYPRPPYLAPGIPVTKSRILFSAHMVDVPKIDYPIAPVENFKLAAAHKTPYWLPNDMLDFQTMFSQALGLGRQQGPITTVWIKIIYSRTCSTSSGHG